MTTIHIDNHLYTTRPEQEGRLPKEMAVYDLLERLHIPFTRVDHEVTATIEACHGVDALLGIEICKNLFLCNRQRTFFYMLVMPSDKQFKTKEFSPLVNSSRLSFATPEDMLELLDVTPGSVSIMALMNDKENRVQLVIDNDLLLHEDFGCHPCMNTSSLRLKRADVFGKFLEAVHHTPIYLTLKGKEQ